MAENLVLGPILACLAQIWAAKFFSTISFRQSLDTMVSYHHVQYQETIIIQFWENLVKDRRTGRRTYRRNIVKRPIKKIKKTCMHTLWDSGFSIRSFQILVFFLSFLMRLRFPFETVNVTFCFFGDGFEGLRSAKSRDM